MELKDWLSLVALFLSAIVAVLIGQYLQDRKTKNDRKYHNKFYVFTTVLGLRHAKGSDEQFVIAMNQIPIVFNENKKVIERLNKFIKTHKDNSPSIDNRMVSLNSDLNDLVIEMAKDLKYSEVDNDLMQSFFYPDSSYFRHEANLVYNEIYSRENYDRLYQSREIGKYNQKKNPKDEF